jgi:hypothetical protein
MRCLLSWADICLADNLQTLARSREFGWLHNPSRWRTAEGISLYKCDDGAWLMSHGSRPGAGFVSPARGGVAKMTPCMALEDLWI